MVLREEPRGIRANRLFDVEVDIAVTHVTERHDADARYQRLARRRGAADELWHFRDRHRYVVLHAGALALLSFRVLLAEAPDRGALRFRFGDYGVGYNVVRQSRFQYRL